MKRWNMKLRNLVLSVAAGLTATACTAPEPAALPQPPPSLEENDLKFDMRYYDSIEMTPRSARTERQLAIFRQLQRLDMVREFRKHDRERGVTPEPDTNAIYEQVSGEPAVRFPSKAAALADNYRKIDSLKVLENIPLTPH